LASKPTNSVAIIRIRETTKTISAARRTARGASSEPASMMAMAGTRKRACRLTKKNVSTPSRSATGGLAAKDRTTPPTISRPKAASM
jgi:hypothetical protein